MANNEMNERVAPIIITDSESGKEYTLEFNRESVKFAESRGFSIQDVDRMPFVKLPELFWYAFRMHHMNVSKEKADRILFDDLGGMPEGMAERLGALYGSPYDALINKENKPKNPNVTVQF